MTKLGVVGMLLLCAALVTTPSASAGGARQCHARAGMPDPSAKIATNGPTCALAQKVIGDFFAKVQRHGPPITVDGFRCTAEGELIECRRRRSRVTYLGGP